MRCVRTFVPFCLVFSGVLLDQSDVSGTLQGRVAQANSGEPLSDVQITLVPLVENAPPPPAAARRLAVSDSTGRFSFTDLRPGDYLIETQYEGYFSASSKPRFTKISAGTTTNITLPMNPGAVISGTVRDSAGQPVVNGNVEIMRVGYRGGFPVLRTVRTQATDDRGEYRLFWVPAGEYYLAVTARALAPNARAPQNLETFYPSDLNAVTATPLTVKPGEEASGIDIAMRSGRLVRISGEVISTVTPPPPPITEQGVFAVIAQAQNRTADVLLVGRDTAVPAREEPRHVAVRLNGSSGEFEMPNIPAGSYDLYAIVRDQNAPFAVGRAAVDIRDQDVTDIKITIRSGVAINGTVSVSGNGVATNKLRVLLQPEGTMARVGLMPPPAAVDANGRFTVVGVPDGRYRATFVGWIPDDSYLDEVRQNGLNVYDSGFDVGTAAPMPVELIIKSGAGTVEGAANAGSRVSLVPQLHPENLLRYAETMADMDGKFVFRGVAPGNYKLFVIEDAPDGAFADPRFAARYEDRGRLIRVN